MSDDTWRENALCRQTDPEIYFPERGGSTRDAKETCLACEVRTSCLEYALDSGQNYGVWGGVNERELRRLHRARRAATKTA
ncbi:WhiB family transcriptional regulator [Streptomyces sp. NPDC057580]|uniref:WhiB family transcriptional regulator n=1 Tax=Streptomyces sp. NPDC057580 TaxID=3346173 RepID=UPI0036A261DB